ncbi:hypothetical protein HU200_066194 [Digitaria exilis]|uniref:Uncharacterized protein n=1 Tax=Digitaria exilis TaxID=1010633 RepID=A0A835A1H6_9POAL|nr:hypothetical protein HU200_066194 [Digitaria exilis]
MNSSWLLLALVLLSCFPCYPAARHGRKDPRPPLTGAVVVGSVHSGSETTNTISVHCHDGNGRTVFQKEVVTDRHGRFHVHLPQETSGRLPSVTSCSVRLQQPSNHNAAACAATATSSSRGLRLVAPKRRGGGARVFSAGEFGVHVPELCGQKGIFFPPLPLVPEPPNIGGVPIPPNPITPAPPSLVPPLLPTPSPPSILPPLVPQPPPLSGLPPLLQSPPPHPHSFFSVAPSPCFLVVPPFPARLPSVPWPASFSSHRRPRVALLPVVPAATGGLLAGRPAATVASSPHLPPPPPQLIVVASSPHLVSVASSPFPGKCDHRLRLPPIGK